MPCSSPCICSFLYYAVGKKKDEEKESEASENEGEDDEDEEDDIGLDGQVDEDEENFTFEFKDMNEEFRGDIARLLNSLTKKSGSDELSKAVSEQSKVGTVIVCEEGEDVFGFASMLPLASYMHLDVFKGILADLLIEVQKLPEDGETATIMSACVGGDDSGQTAVMIQGRFINLPLQLIPSLHGALLGDLEWAQNEENSVGKKKVKQTSASSGDDTAVEVEPKFSEIEYVLLLSPCTRQVDKGQDQSTFSPDVTNDSSSLLYDHFEDEIYFQESLASIFFKPRCADTTFAAALVPVSSLSACVEGIKKLTGE